MSTETSPLLPSTSFPTESRHYLTTPRAIIYQATSLISAIDGIFGTLTLTLMKKRSFIAAASGGFLDMTQAYVAGGLLTLAGSLAGAACGILFLVLMLHPGHSETPARVIAKEAVFSTAASFFLVASILATVVVARGSMTLYTPGLDAAQRQALIVELGGSLAYRDYPTAIIFVVLGWVCWVTLALSLYLVSRAGRHVLRHGPATDAPKGIVERIADRYLGWVWEIGTN